jgi:hypothetical protein
VVFLRIVPGLYLSVHRTYVFYAFMNEFISKLYVLYVNYIIDGMYKEESS